MSTERQRIVRVPGSRRARLTAAPGTEPEPAAELTEAEGGATASGGASGATSGPNDERLRRDVPPHY